MLELPQALIDEMIAHARTGKPAEVCGMIVRELDGQLHLYRIRNVWSNPTDFYEMDPQEQGAIVARLMREDREADLKVIYHSHPVSPARPSIRDRLHASVNLKSDPSDRDEYLPAYPETTYIIVSLQDDARPDVRGWQIKPNLEVESVEIRV